MCQNSSVYKLSGMGYKMAKLSIMGILSNVQILFFTARKGKLVGTDKLGNKYYTGKPRKGTKHERRWVIYKDQIDASLVPAEWHGWLHRQTDVIPASTRKKDTYRQKWQKEHIANQTGGKDAYFPKGYNATRDHATGDYEAWTPPK